ncbi:MAG: hypothetical protein M0Z59_06975 [Nitrospiraceae bacterium]|nr:hypothetical protein [Nitrospiraceae bacterium]
MEPAIKKTLAERIRLASERTPEPARAGANLTSFFESLDGADGVEKEKKQKKAFLSHMDEIARLFSASQFLANFCISNPGELLAALEELKNINKNKKTLTKAYFAEKANPALTEADAAGIAGFMKALRLSKKRGLLLITLRDLGGETDIRGSMGELSFLAEVIIDSALRFSLQVNRRRFGTPDGERLAIIALGKLGGEELNYSSDVDLMAVYAPEEGMTSGSPGPSGIVMNRITSHEFFSKTVELLGRLLSTPTEDGIAYRVDFRLRPQGQKGEIALPLAAFKSYYEQWGRTWERMMLIRARPAAGDLELGRVFLEAIGPFVWRRTSDYSEIEEIRSLKKKIDTIFSRNDIKRGYGGLREAEFFVQTFQLLFGADRTSLRTHRLFDAIEALRQLGTIPDADLTTLWENYLYLRRLEHYLQMKDDLQTHTVPASDEEILPLARNMGYPSGYMFLSDLRLRRMKIKSMYNTLLGTEEDVYAEAFALVSGEHTDGELRGYLLFRGVEDAASALSSLKNIGEGLALFPTGKRLELSRRIIPELVEKALRAESPDKALAGLEGFVNTLGVEEAYLTGIMEQKNLRDGLVKMFSLSPYLTRIFLAGPGYLGLMIEETGIIRKPMARLERALEQFARLKAGEGLPSILGEYKRYEEMRLGMLFLSNILQTGNLLRYLSHMADAAVRLLLHTEKAGDFLAVIALGKLGGREITFSSDLDIIFLAGRPDGARRAEALMKAISAYTPKGELYRVDARLRPEGTKGALVNGIEGYRQYYLEHARNWEIQALLKARPVGGAPELCRGFLKMAGEVIRERAPEIKRGEIRQMRARIVKELSEEAPGAVDIKLGPGGIEDIEFHVQWLQLENCAKFPGLMIQNTPAAIKRLYRYGLLERERHDALIGAYGYMRRLETLGRLNDDKMAGKDAGFTRLAALFMGHKDEGEFLAHLEKLRRCVLDIVEG